MIRKLSILVLSMAALAPAFAMDAARSEAKNVIADGHVLVNGQIETQKRKKIVGGDVIEFDGVKYTVKLG